jgi:hypothetical protein
MKCDIPFSYLIWSGSDSKYYAKNGLTGKIDFSGSVLTTILQSTNNVLTNTGGSIYLKELQWDVSISTGANVFIWQIYKGTLTFYGNVIWGGVASAVNLALIPANMNLTYNNGWEVYWQYGYFAHGVDPQITFLDYNTVRTVGNPSMRIETHTPADSNTEREVNTINFAVTPGKHVVGKAWMKVQTDSSWPGYPECGARIGIDFYSGALLPATAFWYNYFSGGHYEYAYVQDANGGIWQQRTLDFIVPAYVSSSNGTPTVPTGIIFWAQGRLTGSPTCWIADAELYIT